MKDSGTQQPIASIVQATPSASAREGDGGFAKVFLAAMVVLLLLATAIYLYMNVNWYGSTVGSTPTAVVADSGAQPANTAEVNATTAAVSAVAETPSASALMPLGVEKSENPATPTPFPIEPQPVEPPQAVVGTVQLDVKPWGNVSVNGAARGASPPLKRLSLPPGTYSIEVSNPASASVSRTIEVQAGKSATLRHTFK